MTDARSDLLRSAAELAAATGRLPWTLGLWGVQQGMALVDPTRPWSRTTTAFDDLARSARTPLEGPLRNFERAGDHLQTGMVDAAVDLVSGSWREPRAAFDRAWSVLGRTWSLVTGGGSGGSGAGDAGRTGGSSR